MSPCLSYTAFSQRRRSKLHNEDAVLLDGRVHQGSVREHGLVNTSQPRCFAVADRVVSTLPRTASRRLLELLQTHLSAERVPPNRYHRYSTVCSKTMWPSVPTQNSMAWPLRWWVCACSKIKPPFDVGDSRAYLLADGQARLLSRNQADQ